MARINNYEIQLRQAQARFLEYDQQALIRKLKLQADENYLYVTLLCKTYRLCRHTGSLQRLEESFVDANTHSEVMTLLDLICDSRPDRYLSGNMVNMSEFGLRFHQVLLESKDPFAEAIHQDREGFCRACLELAGRPYPGADMAYSMELFDGLRIAILFWEGDEEFPPRVRYLWDANALMYLKYETMYFALGILRSRILSQMRKNPRHLG